MRRCSLPNESAPLSSAENSASLAIRRPERVPLTPLTQRDRSRDCLSITAEAALPQGHQLLYVRRMSIRPWRDIERRKSRQIMIGSVPVGGDAPISVQTMTNTPTEDAKATIDQIRRCEEAGADIIRVSCPTAECTDALKTIVSEARVPIVADIHFHYKRALEAAEA